MNEFQFIQLFIEENLEHAPYPPGEDDFLLTSQIADMVDSFAGYTIDRATLIMVLIEQDFKRKIVGDKSYWLIRCT